MSPTDVLLAVMALGVGVALAWRSHPLAKGALFASAILVAGLLFLPGSQLTGIAGKELVQSVEAWARKTPWQLSDWIHFAIFSWLGVLLWLGRPDLRGWKAWLAIVVLAVAAELAQVLSPDRQTRLDDVLLNLGGGMLGIVVGILIRQVVGKGRR